MKMEHTTQKESMFLPLDSDSDEADKFLTFIVDRQLYAMSIRHVVQIVSMQDISEIPDSADYLKGVITLRGSIIPVIDIRLRLGMPEKAYDERTCIIVVSMGQREAGLIVDGVDAVVSFSEENIVPPPKITEHRTQGYLSGLGRLDDRVLLVVDIAKVLPSHI